MLVYKHINSGKIVHGDVITEKSMRMIGQIAKASRRCEQHGSECLFTLEKHQPGGEKEIAYVGDYFYCTPGANDFSFMPAEEFEALYDEVYDPEKDGSEYVYFDPSTDEHRPWDESIVAPKPR